MQLVMLTNMPSYHQVQLGHQFARLLGEENFRLVFEKNTSDDRAEMGWSDQYHAKFIIRLWESGENIQTTEAWIESADVVIQGRFPMHFVRRRIAAGKLTFAYQERFWKRSFSYPRAILRLPRIIKRYWSVNRPNYHLLAAGAYVAPDLAMLGCFRNRAWKYGYFIDQPLPKVIQAQDEPKTSLSLLWCARFSKVKQAADALTIVDGLRAKGVACELTMIGDGEEKALIEAKVIERGLQDIVHFSGWRNEAEVAEAMQRSDIFLMTSGPGEGWALVINEAMSHGCMVVANESVGAAPWLITQGVSGYLYNQATISSVAERLASLDKKTIIEMGGAAQHSHATVWSAHTAAERLIGLSRVLMEDDLEAAQQLYTDGPCSPT